MHSRVRLFVAAGAAALLATAQSAHADTVLSGTTTTDNAFFAFISTNPARSWNSDRLGNIWQSSFAISIDAGTGHLLSPVRKPSTLAARAG